MKCTARQFISKKKYMPEQYIQINRTCTDIRLNSERKTTFGKI